MNQEQREALIRHGYPADLPPRGVAGRPSEIIDGINPAGGRLNLRNRVCYLDGIEIDGHMTSDLDLGGLMCIHCDYDGLEEW